MLFYHFFPIAKSNIDFRFLFFSNQKSNVGVFSSTFFVANPSIYTKGGGDFSTFQIQKDKFW